MAIEAPVVKRWQLEEGDELVRGLDAVRLLGGGTSFEAYLAWDVRRHALVVAKVVRPHLVDDAGVRAALAREADALAGLSHPVLPRLFDSHVCGPRPLLVLELLDGPRLSTVVRRYGLALEQILPLALELCSVLHYLAAEGWIHRDVKPSNVILASPPRLVDLSVAARFDPPPASSTPTGTDAYMAPEQCDPMRFRELGPPTDVWGLGVTLYEALARRRPFPDGAAAATAALRFPQLVENPAPLPRDVPAAIAEPVLACLEPSPGDRPSATEVAALLEPLSASLPRPKLGKFRPTDR